MRANSEKQLKESEDVTKYSIITAVEYLIDECCRNGFIKKALILQQALEAIQVDECTYVSKNQELAVIDFIRSLLSLEKKQLQNIANILDVTESQLN